MPTKPSEETHVGVATLSRKAKHTLSQVLQDIRSTVSHLNIPSVSPLAVVDATAIDAIKDLYYILNNEDPLNTMPARKQVLDQRLVRSFLLPLATAVHADPASQTNQKRWSIPMYQTLRLLSVLSLPISIENDLLKPGCSLDAHLMKLRTDFALNPPAMASFVALLQYYMQRKAEKQADFASAEETKLEDARIDNILRFFRNILCAPRRGVGPAILGRDRGVHLALVAALSQADLYSTLTIFFSSKEDAASQYSDLVFLVADVYAQTLRHTSPQEIYRTFRAKRRSEAVVKIEKQESEENTDNPGKTTSVFDQAPTNAAPNPPQVQERVAGSRKSSRSFNLRDAIQRERAVIGGIRAISKSARWTSRHSGGFISAPRTSSANGAGDNASVPPGQQITASEGEVTPSFNSQRRSRSTGRVMTAQNAIHSRLSLNPDVMLADQIRINSEIMCLQAAKGRLRIRSTKSGQGPTSETMRRDLQHEGLKGIVALVIELIDECLDHFLKELRSRLQELKSRNIGDDTDALLTAQRAFLNIIGSVVGFHRNRYGKVRVHDISNQTSVEGQIHQDNMTSLLSSDLKIVKLEWASLESILELESFRLVFRMLVEASDAVKNKTKRELLPEDVELATFAVKEMMLTLQGMTAADEENSGFVAKDTEQIAADIRNNESKLTTREIALNTIEDLFTEEVFLNAPADLAKDYNVKQFSFKHLTNIVEVTHAFTTILLDEKELAQLQVSKRKPQRTKRKSKKAKDAAKDAAKDSVKNQAEKTDTRNGESIASPNQGQNVSAENSNDDQISHEGGQSENLKKEITHPPDVIGNVPPVPGEAGGHDQGEQDTPVGCPESDSAQPVVSPQENGGGAADVNEETGKIEEDSSSSSGEKSCSSDSDLEPAIREIESVGIIRRFAHAKALQSIFLPMRAALCNASSMTGKMHNIPEGAEAILSPVVIAKSVQVLAAVWRVAKSQERGALCGQFFNFATMQLLSTSLQASNRECVREKSVLACFAAFAKDATKTFFLWLKLNPGLTLDMFFPMEKQCCTAYVSSMRHRELLLQERDRGEDSGNDSDVSNLIIPERHEREVDVDANGNVEFETAERRAIERRERKSRRARNQLRKNVVERRRDRRNVEEDEDVEDFDKLDIGLPKSESSDSEDKETNIAQGKAETPSDEPSGDDEKDGAPPRRLPVSKRSRKLISDSSSDEESVPPRKSRRRVPRKEKNGKGVGSSKPKRQVPKPAEEKRIHESSDEYNEEDMKILDDIED